MNPNLKWLQLFLVIGFFGVATGVLIARGLTAAAIPLIVGGAVIWGVVWIGASQADAALTHWLERRGRG
jgi:hypothetical protein